MNNFKTKQAVASVDNAQAATIFAAEEAPVLATFKGWLLARQNEALRGMYNSTGEAFGKHCDDFMQLTTAYQVFDRFMALSRG